MCAHSLSAVTVLVFCNQVVFCIILAQCGSESIALGQCESGLP